MTLGSGLPIDGKAVGRLIELCPCRVTPAPEVLADLTNADEAAIRTSRRTLPYCRGYEAPKARTTRPNPEEIEAIQVESTHILDIDKFRAGGHRSQRQQPLHGVDLGERKRSGSSAVNAVRPKAGDQRGQALVRLLFEGVA